MRYIHIATRLPLIKSSIEMLVWTNILADLYIALYFLLGGVSHPGAPDSWKVQLEGVQHFRTGVPS